jgi:hypothetical protein
MLEMEPSDLPMLGKHFTTELYSQPNLLAFEPDTNTDNASRQKIYVFQYLKNISDKSI